MAQAAGTREKIRSGAARTPLPHPGFEVVVVGAGVVGLAIAAAFAKAGRSVLVLERESGIARGITSRNSEVIHAGIYYPADSLKATLCVEGRRALYAWCADKRVGHRRLGKLIVTTDPDEDRILEDLIARGRANGVEGLERIGAAEVGRLEPELRARGALLSPETGIVDGRALCLSLLAAAESNGAMLALERNVEALAPTSFGWRLEVSGAAGEVETIDAGLVVDAAGLDADRLAARAAIAVDELGWRQHPCKGDYFVLAPGARVTAPRRLVYPVPQQAGLGIHATLDLAGRLRFGPDAAYVSVIDFDVDPAKAEGFRAEVARYLPAMADAQLLPDYAGIRPKLAGPGEGFRDFVVEEASAQGAPGFIACIGIESPGLTAALALAERVRSWDSL
ncbi:MAG: FAD-dependent oxidoreductase [Deltaproteobacteria bacterium]|jgi:L-2-hydroxyglutarate oxidase LhgO|nr:FAD-dependent oxidoreductase [Deltaproteobacteria bacterium]